jgi:hypothetical protein
VVVDNAWLEMGKQAPYVALMIVLVVVFLNYIQKGEASRVQNARDLEDKREAHERDINNMWANSIKLIVDQQEKSHQAVMEMLKQHEQASRERYERMAKTDDLIKAIQDQKTERRQ